MGAGGVASLLPMHPCSVLRFYGFPYGHTSLLLKYPRSPDPLPHPLLQPCASLPPHSPIHVPVCASYTPRSPMPFPNLSAHVPPIAPSPRVPPTLRQPCAALSLGTCAPYSPSLLCPLSSLPHFFQPVPTP